jgi:O-acetylserine/cysteine efflux transporter
VSSLEVAAALLVALLWGVQFVTSKYGVDVFPPLLFVTPRFAAVGLLLLPLAGRPSRSEIAAVAAILVFFRRLVFRSFLRGAASRTCGPLRRNRAAYDAVHNPVRLAVAGRSHVI